MLDQKLNFLNMVMWHIKLKGVISRQGYSVKFYPGIKLMMTLWWDSKVKYHYNSSIAWGFAMARHGMCSS